MIEYDLGKFEIDNNQTVDGAESSLETWNEWFSNKQKANGILQEAII